MVVVLHMDRYPFQRPMSGNSHMVWIVLGAAVCAVLALIAALWAALGAFRTYLGAIEPQESAGDQKLIWDEFAKQRLAIGEGIERVDRAERRIANTVKRARARMGAAGFIDDGVEAEAEGLPQFDEGVLPIAGVPDVSPDVERPRYSGPSAIPGVSEDELAQIRERIT